jgi:GTP:adenosylcobinamide-phosphate guanylyltransferase
MTSPNDLFAQFPIVDAICAHLDRNSDLLAFASACKGTAAMKEACVQPRLSDRVCDFVNGHIRDIQEVCRERNLPVICYEYPNYFNDMAHCVLTAVIATLCVRIYFDRIYIADKFFNWHSYRFRLITVQRKSPLWTFKSLLEHLLDNMKEAGTKYVWTSPS